MKISKKILGVALVLTMILNVFAVGAFAAFPDDTAVKLMLSTDKETYNPGEEVVITFSEQVIPEIGSMMIGGQYEIAYNSAAMEPYKTSTTLTDHGFTAIQGGVDLGISGVQLTASNASVAGTDASICYVVADTDVVFPATDKVDLFTVKMKIKADAPAGTYTIGFNPAGYEGFNAYSNDGLGLGGLYGTDASAFGFSVANMYEYGTCTITVAGGGGSTEPEQPTITVENLDTKVRWATTDEETKKDVIYVGFEGKISGLTNVSTLAEIGFKFSTSDSALATATNVKSFVIYDFTAEAANTYKFRSIVRRPLAKADIDGTTTHNIYAQAYVMVTGATTPIAATNIISTTLQAEYAQGVTNGMEDRFA